MKLDRSDSLRLFINLWLICVGVTWVILSIVYVFFSLPGHLENAPTGMVETPADVLVVAAGGLVANLLVAVLIGITPVIGQIVPFILWASMRKV